MLPKFSGAVGINYCAKMFGTTWSSVRIPSFLSLAQQERSYSFPNKPLLTMKHGDFEMYLTLMEGNLVSNKEK